jgi:hypothetical protein
MSFLNRLATLFSRMWREDVVELLAEEVAQQCWDAMRSRVVPKAAEMSAAMQLGYLRAHAVDCVAAELDATAAQLCLTASQRPTVARAAVARLIGMTFGDLPSSVPVAEVRAAAA